MILNILLLISALSLSSVAAYFSIIGLATMFPGAIAAVVVMALVLEISKVVSAVWTHQNWKRTSRFAKSYLVFAIFVLMGITSMGIFGFLSKAHIEHQKSTDEITAQIAQIEEKVERENEYISRQKSLISKAEERTDSSDDKSDVNIKREQEKIRAIYERMEKDISLDKDKVDSLRSRIASLDAPLNELRASSGGIFSNNKKKIAELEDQQAVEREDIKKKISEVDKSTAAYRKKAEGEVDAIKIRIEEYQNTSYSSEDSNIDTIEQYNDNIKQTLGRIDNFNSEKFKLSNSEMALEAEVGPIKYMAALMHDVSGSEFDLGEAVRLVIIIIIFVFDPLAIMMVICATSQFSFFQPRRVAPKSSDDNNKGDIETDFLGNNEPPPLQPEPEPEPEPESETAQGVADLNDPKYKNLGKGIRQLIVPKAKGSFLKGRGGGGKPREREKNT